MKMSTNEASALQDYLYLTTLDGYCPDAFIGGRQAIPPDAHDLWQFAVDMIYRCLQCDFLVINENWTAAHNIEGALEFARLLAKHDPFDSDDFNESGALYWIEPELTASKKTKDLIARFQIDLASAACQPLIEHIEDSFEANGLAYGEILVPVGEGI
ncbi:hypothetical protein [Cupriavidus sp. BIS7]|uniref:hypothetical protein n=1 Tax=Cupriavidus sp. BIS7 TaxID=1217718 RepID=UPI0012F62A91|nr:hypothetical protein [Cupriavidus sp. BIS7]